MGKCKHKYPIEFIQYNGENIVEVMKFIAPFAWVKDIGDGEYGVMMKESLGWQSLEKDYFVVKYDKFIDVLPPKWFEESFDVIEE